MQRNLPSILDVRALVVDELSRDKSVLVGLFQRVGRDELKFLVDSGLFFGALLGALQAFAFAFYPAPWTVPAGSCHGRGRGGGGAAVSSLTLSHPDTQWRVQVGWWWVS